MPSDCAIGGLLDGLLLTGAPHRIVGRSGRHGLPPLIIKSPRWRVTWSPRCRVIEVVPARRCGPRGLALPDGAADHEAAVAAAETFLTALGLRLDTDHPRRTAEWMAVPVGYLIVSAEHLCTTVRGVQAWGSSVAMTAWRGRFVDDPAGRAEVLSLAEVRR
jgi:hypothetical protein